MPDGGASSQERRPATTSTRARRWFDQQKWTAVAVHNPSVFLIACDRDLVVILAKHRRASAHGDWLQGLHLITIPNGWRLRLLEMLAGLARGRLPDEWLYMKALIRRTAAGYQLIVDGRVQRTRSEPFPVRSLTRCQLQRMLSCSGRLLRAQLVTMFREWLPVAVVKHRPWMLRMPAPLQVIGRAGDARQVSMRRGVE